MSEAKGQHEPSMEEILASIRRIIAEDGEAPAPEGAPQAAPKPAPAAVPVPVPTAVSVEPAAKPASDPAPDDILELTEMVEPDGSVVSVNEPVAAAEPPRVAARPEPEPEPELEPEEMSAEAPIVSPATAAASVAALSRITELSPHEVHERDIPLGAGHLTLEMLVRAELRPILRDWLDANLPGIVERIVRSEIARLVQGVPKR